MNMFEQGSWEIMLWAQSYTKAASLPQTRFGFRIKEPTSSLPMDWGKKKLFKPPMALKRARKY